MRAIMIGGPQDGQEITVDPSASSRIIYFAVLPKPPIPVEFPMLETGKACDIAAYKFWKKIDYTDVWLYKFLGIQ